MSQSRPLATFAVLRRVLFGILLVGLVGTLTELLASAPRRIDQLELAFRAALA